MHSHTFQYQTSIWYKIIARVVAENISSLSAYRRVNSRHGVLVHESSGPYSTTLLTLNTSDSPNNSPIYFNRVRCSVTWEKVTEMDSKKRELFLQHWFGSSLCCNPLLSHVVLASLGGWGHWDATLSLIFSAFSFAPGNRTHCWNVV